MVLRISWVVVDSPKYRSGKVCRDGQLDSHEKLVKLPSYGPVGIMLVGASVNIAGEVERDDERLFEHLVLIIRSSSNRSQELRSSGHSNNADKCQRRPQPGKN